MNKASTAVACSSVRSSPPSLLRPRSRGAALRSLWFLGCLTLATAWSPTAAAQQPIDKDADAERLFREGQKLMEERRFGEACPKFEAAYRKDQQLGTLLNLAYCHKEQGAVWQSWLEFKEAEVKALELKRNDRRDFARQRMAELEKSLARVVVEPQQKVELTEVLVEDRRVPEAEKSHPFAAEPGQRKLTFRAKGKKQVVQLITITKGDRPQRISVPDMEDQEPFVEPVEPAAEPTTPVEPEPAGADRKDDGSLQKTFGLVALGVGVVGIGVGAVYGLRTLINPCTDGEPANKNDPSAPKTPSCTEEERNEASQTGAVSTVGFIAGGALVLGGILLYLTAPSAKSSATVGRVSRASDGRLRMVPEIGAGWAGVRGVF